jgi:hypothetical protein
VLSAHAQSGDASANANQQKARAALDAMVAALGGQKWLSLETSMQHGRTSGFYQGKPTGAIADYTEFKKFPDQSRVELGKKRNVFEIVDGKQGWEVTYHGKKALRADQMADIIRRRNHSIRTAIQVWMKDPRTLLIFDGQSQVERHLTDKVTLIDAQNDSVTIQMDDQTHLPLRRSWQWRDPLYKDKNTDAEEYDDYHPVDGIPTPFTISRYHNGDLVNQRFLYRAAYNVPLPPDSFNPDVAAAKFGK